MSKKCTFGTLPYTPINVINKKDRDLFAMKIIILMILKDETNPEDISIRSKK